MLVTSLKLFALVALLALPITPLPISAQTSSQQKISPSLLAQITANPVERVPIIVQLNTPGPPATRGMNLTLAQQAVSILQANGQSVGALPIVQGAAGYANAAGIQVMSALPQVAAIHQDAVVRPQRPPTAGPPPPVSTPTSLYPREVSATRVWQQGGSGRGVTVAVLDSGVAPDTDLTATGNRILASVSFAGPRDPMWPDEGGHGTHVAGTIAGDGTGSAGEYVGMAPAAGIVDVQVLNWRGSGRYSSILRGLEFVIRHKAQFNIRVVNLSFGAPARNSYITDPLAAGVELAWREGLVVVAAAGNAGPSSGTVESPGVDPYVITVGATDDQATLSLSDDVLAWFSSWGVQGESRPKPDIVAPGRRIVSLYVPGSTLATRLSDHVETASNGATLFRLSGTSMAAPIVSGAVALMLERYPTLTPDQVKKILVSSAQRFGQLTTSPPAGAAGAGLLDAYAATNTGLRASANGGLRLSDGAARTLYSALYGQPLTWKNPTYLGRNWNLVTWPTLTWDNIAWDNIAWDNIAWDNIAWDNIAWDQTSWDNIAWDNIAWDGAGWDNIAWDNIAWD
jgi:serine protease AprX